MFSHLFEFIKHGGLPLLFVLIFLEANPIMGSFIPGQTLVLVMSIFISTTHSYNLFWFTLLVFIAAFSGDLFSYFLGKKLGVKGLKAKGFDSNSKIYKSCKIFFQKYGLWSIILGRQFNLTRAFIPFLSGVFKVPTYKFVFFAFISNIFWTLLTVYLGFYFGNIILEKMDFIFEFILFLIIYLGIIYLIFRSFKNLYFQNLLIIRRFALHNIISLITILLMMIILVLLSNFELIGLFNELFFFIYNPLIMLLLGFLLSGKFALLLTIFLLTYLLFLKKTRYFLMLLWGMLFSFFFTLVFVMILKKWVGMIPFISVIFFTILVFYASLIFNSVITNSKRLRLINISLVLILFLGLIGKIAQTENIYLTLLSFFIAAIECEIIVLVSHYNVLKMLELKN